MLGFPVMGIWPPDSNGLDVNSLHRAHNKKWVVTSDDQGKVRGRVDVRRGEQPQGNRGNREANAEVARMGMGSSSATSQTVGSQDR